MAYSKTHLLVFPAKYGSSRQDAGPNRWEPFTIGAAAYHTRTAALKVNLTIPYHRWKLFTIGAAAYHTRTAALKVDLTQHADV